jgi:hypothetical protein
MDSAWVQTEGIVQSVESRRGHGLEDAVSAAVGRSPLPAARPQSTRAPSRRRIAGSGFGVFARRCSTPGGRSSAFRSTCPRPSWCACWSPARIRPRCEPQPIDELLRFSFPIRRGIARESGRRHPGQPSGPSYVEDSGAGVKIVNHARMDLRPGDVVDVLGFGHSGSFSPEMRDPQISLVERGPAPSPPSITMDEALEGGYDSRLVTIDATVVDQLRGPSQNALMLQVRRQVVQRHPGSRTDTNRWTGAASSG